MAVSAPATYKPAATAEKDDDARAFDMLLTILRTTGKPMDRAAVMADARWTWSIKQLGNCLKQGREADPQLSRFDPLPRIICLDDFDRGMCGWTQLVGNYEDSLDAMLPGYAQHSHAMLSTLPNWDFGSHGGVDGSYALKIATRPKKGAH